MKSFRIFIIAFLFVLLFGGCTGEPNNTNTQSAKTSKETTQVFDVSYLKAQIEYAKLMPQKSAELIIDAKKLDNYTYEITVRISNPDKQAIQSVRSWLTYNAHEIQASKIDTTHSSFPLTAPSENNIENSLGLVKIGRSFTQEPSTESEMEIAKVIFVKKNRSITSSIDFYDYRDDSSGHTTINALREDKVFNVLKIPSSPATNIQ